MRIEGVWELSSQEIQDGNHKETGKIRKIKKIKENDGKKRILEVLEMKMEIMNVFQRF